jgi:hypothetical protein
MLGLDTAGLPEWKVSLLLAMTLVVVASAHWHSFRAARREVRARDLPTGLRRILSYVARHELHYVKQVPLMIYFVASSVVVVAEL